VASLIPRGFEYLPLLNSQWVIEVLGHRLDLFSWIFFARQGRSAACVLRPQKSVSGTGAIDTVTKTYRHLNFFQRKCAL